MNHVDFVAFFIHFPKYKVLRELHCSPIRTWTSENTLKLWMSESLFHLKSVRWRSAKTTNIYLSEYFMTAVNVKLPGLKTGICISEDYNLCVYPWDDKNQYIFQLKEWLIVWPASPALPLLVWQSLFLSCLTFTTSNFHTVRYAPQRQQSSVTDYSRSGFRLQLSISLGIASCFLKSTTSCPMHSCPKTCLCNTAFLWIFPPFPINPTLLSSFFLLCSWLYLQVHPLEYSLKMLPGCGGKL